MKNILIKGTTNGGLYNYIEPEITVPINTFNESLCAVIATSLSLGTLLIYRPQSFLNPFTNFIPGSAYFVLAHKDFTIFQTSSPLLFFNDIWNDSTIWNDEKTFSST